MQHFTIACVQSAVTPMGVRENVQKAVAWIGRAVQEAEEMSQDFRLQRAT